MSPDLEEMIQGGHCRSAAACCRQLRKQIRLVPAPYFEWKPTLDRFLAALLLLPGLPLLALLMLLVRLTSQGPAIFSQQRVGKNGQLFRMFKIRTMRHDAEAATGPVWSLQRDPRATPVGRLLRTLHLDELPQLFNVLKGEMSLIGPRPERPEFVRVLSEAIPGYLDRILVVPGITGLAQLNLPPDTDLDSVRRKLVLDCEYVQRASLWLDCRLLMATAFRILILPPKPIARAFGVHRTVTPPDAEQQPPARGETSGHLDEIRFQANGVWAGGGKDPGRDGSDCPHCGRRGSRPALLAPRM